MANCTQMDRVVRDISAGGGLTRIHNLVCLGIKTSGVKKMA